MQLHSFLLLASSFAIPIAVAGTIPDDVKRSSPPDMALVVRALDEILPGAKNYEVHNIIARLEEEGHFDSLDKRVSIGLDPSLWVNVSGSCTSCIVACVAGVYTDYRAGNNIPTLTMWGQLAVSVIHLPQLNEKI
ncbi:hypothetical protein TruAng_004926 [Truncatella angustata]|nr:hypothetical protein TruAng_004926 [Truncatella angustata]